MATLADIRRKSLLNFLALACALSGSFLLTAAKHNTGSYEITSEKTNRTGENGETVSPEWQNLLNPSKDEFWKEGAHLPDEGFLMLLKDRNIENARNWLLRMEKKAEIAEEVMSLILKAQEQLVKEGKMKDRYSMVLSDSQEYQQANNLFKGVLDSLTYFFIFRPGCHVCDQTAESLKQFKNVIPLQAVSGSLHNWKDLSDSKHASPETLKDYAADGSLPVVVIADSLHNRVVRLSGVQTKKSLTEASMKLLKLRTQEKDK